MYRLIRLIIKYHFFLLFVFLEIISILLAVNFNKHHNTVYLSSANAIVGSFNSKFNGISTYLDLKNKNEELLKQNTNLLNKSISNYISNIRVFDEKHDSIYSQQYSYTSGKVIQNYVYNKHNYLTIDKGKKNGVVPECGVICPKGIVGIVSKSSDNFSNVISVLNIDLSISAKIKKNNYFGSLNWDGENIKYAKLKEIPFHVDLEIGDTIITSGYSLIFPENILIGTISNFDKIKGGDFYDITVKLSTDFNNINNIYIINNLKKTEILNLSENNDK
jgi:rod shape-determining protein MreC